MKLIELYESFDQPSSADIIALINQMEQDIEQGDIDPENYTVEELLDYFQAYDIILDTDDLYNMIQQPPLDDLIDNIQGDKVVFKGYAGEEKMDRPEGDSAKTVEKMAKKAMKR